MNIEPGDCIVAPPHMEDLRFRETVILIANHTHRNSAGFILNDPGPLTLNDVYWEIGLDESDNLPLPIYQGGPVAPGSIFMLHESEWHDRNTMYINEEWSATSSLQMFQLLLQGGGPRSERIVSGMASWGPGQLVGEMQGEHPWAPTHSWLLLKQPRREWLFEQPVETLWDECVETVSRDTVSEWL